MAKKKTKVGLDELLKIPELKKVNGTFQEARGLMYRNRRRARALLFEFKKPIKWKIHSLFVKFPFVAVWIDKDHKIIKKKIIKPWSVEIGPDKPFTKLFEIPINEFYRREIKNLLALN